MEKSKISSKTWQMENCKNALKKKLRAKHLAKHVKKGQKTANRKITKKIRKVVSRTRQGFGELKTQHNDQYKPNHYGCFAIL